jgi:hypothetical protein
VSHPQFFRAAYATGWAILLSLFVFIGGRELWSGSQGKFIERRVYASTDSYLKALLGLSNGSEQCVDVMSKFYGKRAFVYFCPPREAQGDFVYEILGYLSWPQEIRKIDANNAELKERLASIDRGAVSVFIFFELQPPQEFAQGRRVGPNLWITSSESVR